MRTVAEIEAEREQVLAELEQLDMSLEPLLARRRALRTQDRMLLASHARADAKDRIKALGKRRRVWLRMDYGERLPYGQPLTTLRFGPKNCSVRVASGQHKGDEWRIPYTDLAVEKPTDMEISLNR